MRNFEYDVNNVFEVQGQAECESCGVERAKKTIEIAHVRDKWSRRYDVCESCGAEGAWQLFIDELEREEKYGRENDRT